MISGFCRAVSLVLSLGSRGGGCPAGAKFWEDLGVGHTCLVALLVPCLQSIFQSWPPSGLGCRRLRAGIFVHIIAFWLPGGAVARGASVISPSSLRVFVPPLVSSLEVVA